MVKRSSRNGLPRTRAIRICRCGGWSAVTCELAQSEPVNRHRPAVDVLFTSAVSQVGKMPWGHPHRHGAGRGPGCWRCARPGLDDRAGSGVLRGVWHAAEAGDNGASKRWHHLKEIGQRVLARLGGSVSAGACGHERQMWGRW